MVSQKLNGLSVKEANRVLGEFLANHDESLSIKTDDIFTDGKYLTFNGIDILEKEFDITFVTAMKTRTTDMSFIFRDDKYAYFVGYKMAGETPNIFVDTSLIYSENGHAYSWDLHMLTEFDSVKRDVLFAELDGVPEYYKDTVLRKRGWFFNTDNQSYERPVFMR